MEEEAVSILVQEAISKLKKEMNLELEKNKRGKRKRERGNPDPQRRKHKTQKTDGGYGADDRRYRAI